MNFVIPFLVGVFLYFVVGFLTFRFWVWRCPPIETTWGDTRLGGWVITYNNEFVYQDKSWDFEEVVVLCLYFGPFVAFCGLLIYLTNFVENIIPMTKKLFVLGVKITPKEI